MVMSGGWSVHLTTLFLGKLEQAVDQYFVYIVLHPFSSESVEEENDVINLQESTGQAWIELLTP